MMMILKVLSCVLDALATKTLPTVLKEPLFVMVKSDASVAVMFIVYAECQHTCLFTIEYIGCFVCHFINSELHDIL